MRTLFSLLALVAYVSAAALRETSPGVVTLPTRSTPSLYARLIAERKLKQFLEERDQRRTQVLATGSSSMIDYSDEFYLTPMTFGTPPQTLEIAVDTGSSDTWVVDGFCKSDYCNDMYPYYTRTKFNSTLSSTYKYSSKQFKVEYGSGTVQGHMATDTMTMGGLPIQSQEFGLASLLGYALGHQPLDGCVGMGWPSLSMMKVTPPMQNLLPSLSQPVFTVWMDRKINPSTGGNAGQITFGAADTVNCDSKTWNVPLTAQNYWQFAMMGYSIGAYSDAKKYQVAVDTGTSFILAPSAAVTEIVQRIGATYSSDNGIYEVPCSKMKTLPDLVFHIGDASWSFNIPSVEYVLDLKLKDGMCAVTLGSLSSGGFGPSWVLGQSFGRTWCTTYDIGMKRVVLSKAIHSSV